MTDMCAMPDAVAFVLWGLGTCCFAGAGIILAIAYNIYKDPL